MVLEPLVQVAVGVERLTQTGVLTAPAGAVWVSVGDTLVRVWLPVLVTVNVSVMTSPTALTVTGLADFAVVRLFVGLTGTLTGGDGGDVIVGPVGGVPVLVALSFTDPASKSACVTAYVAVNVAT